MATSTATLATLRARAQEALMDLGAAVWATTTLDEAFKLALGELTWYQPLTKVGTVLVAMNQREVSLASLTGIISVIDVWYPYAAAGGGDAELAKSRVGLDVFWDNGTPKIFLNVIDSPSGVESARVFYGVAHTLNGLAGAAATTFDEGAEAFLVMQACGWACLMRAIDKMEATDVGTWAPNNYAAMPGVWFRRASFYAGMALGARASAVWSVVGMAPVERWVPPYDPPPMERGYAGGFGGRSVVGATAVAGPGVKQ